MTSSERHRSGESSPGGRPDQPGRLPARRRRGGGGGVAFPLLSACSSAADAGGSSAGGGGRRRHCREHGKRRRGGAYRGGCPRSEIPRASRRGSTRAMARRGKIGAVMPSHVGRCTARSSETARSSPRRHIKQLAGRISTSISATARHDVVKVRNASSRSPGCRRCCRPRGGGHDRKDLSRPNFSIDQRRQNAPPGEGVPYYWNARQRGIDGFKLQGTYFAQN